MKPRIAILGAVFCAAACGQNSTGYIFFAPGGMTSHGQTAMTMQVGAGADAILGKGFGVGGELGAIGRRENFSANVLGAFSPNLSYHFSHVKWTRFDPYVTGGYTMLFRGGYLNLGNFGAGMNYWFTRKVGLHVEFRDQVYTQNGGVQMWGARVGVAFR